MIFHHKDTKTQSELNIEKARSKTRAFSICLSPEAAVQTLIHLSVLRVFVVKNLSDDGGDTQWSAAPAANLHGHGNDRKTFGRQGTHIAEVFERRDVLRE